MTNIIFMRPRRDYMPYQDVYRVITLSGFPLRYLDEIDWQEPSVVIGTPYTPDWSSIPRNRRAYLVHWNFERCRSDAALDDMATGVPHPEPDEQWVSDRALATRFGARYVFFGGVDNFATLTVAEKVYDLIMLMYFSHRRQPLRNQLASFRVADWTSGCWGDERAAKIAQSRLMFSAHQDDEPWCEPIKFCLAGMYAIPLLSETCADSGYWKAGQHYLSAPFERLADYAHVLLRAEHDTTLRVIAANAWRLVIRERPFKSQVLDAVAEAVSA